MNTVAKFSIADILAAMERNGYPQCTGNYIRYEPDTATVMAACAIGQAALNLGVVGEDGDWCEADDEADDIASALDTLGYRLQHEWVMPCVHAGPTRSLSAVVVHLNDEHKMPVPEIARTVRKLLEGAK